MVEAICSHIHNYFTDEKDRHAGTYAIVGGSIDLPFLIDGQYFRIVGSALNDGVYLYPASDLKDEAFQGEVWAMRVPAGFSSLCAEIAAWQAQYGGSSSSPYRSEAFGGYSYSRAEGLDAGGAGASAWMNVFRARLNPYRRLGNRD